MNWLDNIIGFFSPEWGVKREAWRQNLDIYRNYDAGDHDRINSNWRVSNQSAEYTDRYTRDNVRARARDLERNSDMMGAVISAYKRNVFGGGYILQSGSGDEKLDDEIEKAWKIWCEKRNCDVTNTQSFNQILRMAVRRKKVDGGMLFVKCYTDGGITPFKLQCFEVDELDVSQTTPKIAGNKVIGGIEYNGFNKAVGYWIKQYNLDGFSIKDPAYVEEKNIIFYFSKTRPSQVREMSDISPTMTRIRDMNEFMVAVSVKERIAACLSVFIKKTIPTSGMGRGITEKSLARKEYEGKTITPGMIKELNAGDEIQIVNPTGQASDATSYIKLQQRLVGAGQGVSYESISRDMSETNYSSARQGSIEDELTYIEEQELLVEVMDEVYESFIISGVLSGLFNIPDFWKNKRRYLEHEWIHAPKKWIDPFKESRSNEIALGTGQKTFQQIAAENGRDWKKQLDDTAEVLEYAKTKNIDLYSILFKKTSEVKGGEKNDNTNKKQKND